MQLVLSLGDFVQEQEVLATRTIRNLSLQAEWPTWVQQLHRIGKFC